MKNPPTICIEKVTPTYFIVTTSDNKVRSFSNPRKGVAVQDVLRFIKGELSDH